MVFKEVGNEFPESWNPEAGESIEGIFKQHKIDVGKKKYSIYILEVNGELKTVWGSKVLDERMLSVKIGELIRITYEGFNDPEKEDWKKFKVEVDKTEEETTEELEAEAEDETEGKPEEPEDSEEEAETTEE